MRFGFRRQYRGPIQAVIVDWAGTIVDHGSSAPAAAFVELFGRNKVTVDVAAARRPMGLPKRAHIETMVAMPEIAAAWRTAHGKPCTAADIDRLYAEFLPLQKELLENYSAIIDGVLSVVAALREAGIKIGSTTGYSRELMEVVLPAARRQGLELDVCVTADEVPAARPAPWMALRAAEMLGVYPPSAIVKIGDTVPDIDEGLNAGMWTIGVTRTGNEVGLSADQVAALAPEELAQRLASAEDRLARAGAHYVVESIAGCLAILDRINDRLALGESP